MQKDSIENIDSYIALMKNMRKECKKDKKKSFEFLYNAGIIYSHV